MKALVVGALLARTLNAQGALGGNSSAPIPPLVDAPSAPDTPSDTALSGFGFPTPPTLPVAPSPPAMVGTDDVILSTLAPTSSLRVLSRPSVIPAPPGPGIGFPGPNQVGIAPVGAPTGVFPSPGVVSLPSGAVPRPGVGTGIGSLSVGDGGDGDGLNAPEPPQADTPAGPQPIDGDPPSTGSSLQYGGVDDSGAGPKQYGPPGWDGDDIGPYEGEDHGDDGWGKKKKKQPPSPTPSKKPKGKKPEPPSDSEGECHCDDWDSDSEDGGPPEHAYPTGGSKPPHTQGKASPVPTQKKSPYYGEDDMGKKKSPIGPHGRRRSLADVPLDDDWTVDRAGVPSSNGGFNFDYPTAQGANANAGRIGSAPGPLSKPSDDGKAKSVKAKPSYAPFGNEYSYSDNTPYPYDSPYDQNDDYDDKGADDLPDWLKQLKGKKKAKKAKGKGKCPSKCKPKPKPSHSVHPYPSKPTHSVHPYPSPPTFTPHPYPNPPTHTPHPYLSPPTFTPHPYPSPPTFTPHPYPPPPTHTPHPYPGPEGESSSSSDSWDSSSVDDYTPAPTTLVTSTKEWTDESPPAPTDQKPPPNGPPPNGPPPNGPPPNGPPPGNTNSGDTWTGDSLSSVCPKTCNPFNPAENKCDSQTTGCVTTGGAHYYCTCRAGYRYDGVNPKDLSQQFKVPGQPYVYGAPGKSCNTRCDNDLCDEVMVRSQCL